MARVLDYSSLVTEPSREEVAAWRSAARARGEQWASTPVTTIIALVVIGVVAAVMAAPVITLVGVLVTAGDGGIGGFLVGLLVVSAIAVGVIALIAVSASRRWSRWVRLDRFARANGLVFAPRSPSPSYPGAIFQLGSNRMTTEHLRTADGRFVDLGSFQYTTGSGKNRTTHRWGFLALELDRRLPHMVLDATANNGLFGGTNLPARFDRSQVLSLEGDFDRYFTLYCPREYERDALYVFTPDLMAILIDEAAPYDVEIVDDWMFVYSRTPFDLAHRPTLERLFRIVETVGAKTLRQTVRYADERIGDFSADIVAPAGARLKRGVSIVAVLVAVAAFAFWAWTMLGPGLGQLLHP